MACDTSGSYKLEMVNDMAVKTGTTQTFVCVADKKTQYTVYDYKYNITGDVTIDYDASGNMIVTLKNGFIQPAGEGVWPTQKTFAAPWYGDLTSPLPCWRSIAMAVSVSPDIPASGWKKCLGGWYSAGTNCNTTCTKDKYGNPPGGTWMYWSDTQADEPWTQKQYQRGGRTIPTLTWNLGPVQSKNGQDLHVYMFARGERACTWNKPDCNSMPWVPSSVPRVDLIAPVCPLEPPVLTTVQQKPDVCESCVDAYLYFAPQDFGNREGVILAVDYKYGNEPWDTALYTSQQVQAGSNSEVMVTLNCLIPERKVCWRAQYITTSGDTSKSEYAEGCFMTEFIPPAWMEVPSLTVAECTLMTQGKPVPEFDHLTNYWGETL